MADVQLYVNDEPLDLGGDTTIALLFQVQSMAELDAKLGSFSRSFTLPATDRNQRLLENSYTFQASTTYPYRVTKARLVTDGLEIGVGNLIVENDGAGASEVRVTFYLNSSPFFQLVNALQLHQLPLGYGEHLYNYSNIYASADVGGLLGSDKQYIYPLIDYTGDPKWLPSDSINGGIYANRMYPASFTRYVLGVIEQETEYTITGDIFDPTYTVNGQPVDLITNLIWPWAEAKFTRDTNYQARSTYKLYATAPKVTVNNANLALTEALPSGLPNGYRYGGGILPVAPSTSPTEYFTYQQPTSADRADIRVTITGKAVFAAPPACAFTPSAQGLTTNATNLSGTMTLPNGTVYTAAAGTLNFSATGMPAGTYDMRLTFDLRCEAHRTWKVLYNGAASVNCNTLVTDVQWLKDRGTTEEERLIRFSYPDSASPWVATREYTTNDLVTYLGNVYQSLSDNNLNKPPNINPADWFLWSPPNYPPRRGSWAWVSGSSGLPNVTVAGWLKMLAQLWGCLVLVDETKREVEFFQMKKLQANRGLAVDWSSKLVNPATIKWNTRGNYGQASTLRFVNEPLDDVTLGAYTFPVDDTTLPATKNVVELQIAASDDVERWGNISTDLWAPLIRRLNAAGDFASNSPKTRLLYLNRVDNVLGDFAYFKRDATTPYATRTLKQPMAYFAPNTLSPVGRVLGYDYLWPLHWVWLEFMSNEYKELQATFMLEAVDVYKLDYRRPVYIASLGAFFFIQQIKDWVPGRPVTVELVKL